MEKLFEGKTVFITGGGTGIGAACAVAFAAEGAVATIAGRTKSTLKETVAQIQAASGTARYAACDVTDEQAVKDAIAVAIGDAGRLEWPSTAPASTAATRPIRRPNIPTTSSTT